MYRAMFYCVKDWNLQQVLLRVLCWHRFCWRTLFFLKTQTSELMGLFATARNGTGRCGLSLGLPLKNLFANTFVMRIEKFFFFSDFPHLIKNLRNWVTETESFEVCYCTQLLIAYCVTRIFLYFLIYKFLFALPINFQYRIQMV